jgi:hypothetical protein
VSLGQSRVQRSNQPPFRAIRAAIAILAAPRAVCSQRKTTPARS